MRVFTPAMSGINKLVVRIVALILPIVCICASLTPTVFAQNTYVITDGDQVVVHTTYETNPADVLDEAGVQLSTNDIYTTEETDGVSEITVQRSQNITIDYCGEKIQATSYGETLDELLSRLDVRAYGDYHVSLPMDTLTYDGMEVTIEYIVESEETYTVDIPYEITYCKDPKLPVGEEKVLIPGAVGEMSCRTVVTYVNGTEENRTVVEETVLRQPVDQLVAKGTATDGNIDENAPIIGDGFIITADGEYLTFDKKDTFVTTAYSHLDAGCDMTTATGTTVRIGAVAVDPTVIPYGTRMFIASSDGKHVYGIATAEDCGGGVQGKHIDLYMPTVEQCMSYGIRNATVYFLS